MSAEHCPECGSLCAAKACPECRRIAADLVAKAAQALVDEPKDRQCWDRLRFALRAWRRALPDDEHPWGTQR